MEIEKELLLSSRLKDKPSIVEFKKKIRNLSIGEVYQLQAYKKEHGTLDSLFNDIEPRQFKPPKLKISEKQMV